MANITAILSVIFTFIIFLCVTSGEDLSKETLLQRIVRGLQTGNSQGDYYINWPVLPPWYIYSSTTRTTVPPPTKTTKRRKKPKVTKTTSRTTPKITARTTAKVTASAILASSSSFTTFQLEALAQTNKYRADYCAPNLQLDPQLNSIAQNYANKLLSLGYLQHSSNGYGENLYYSYNSQNSAIKGSEAVNSWYNEVKDYDYTQPGFSGTTGHFTQLVWINSKKLGIGIACGNNKCFVVANYEPAGNFLGQFPANVKPKGSCK